MNRTARVISYTRPCHTPRLRRKRFARWSGSRSGITFLSMHSMQFGQTYRRLFLLFLVLLVTFRSIPVFAEEVKSGSGFIFHPDGYILTNNHVVADSTEQVVVLSNGNRVTAKLVATDPKRDLALLKIQGSNFAPLPIGESRKISVMD